MLVEMRIHLIAGSAAVFENRYLSYNGEKECDYLDL